MYSWPNRAASPEVQLQAVIFNFSQILVWSLTELASTRWGNDVVHLYTETTSLKKAMSWKKIEWNIFQGQSPDNEKKERWGSAGAPNTNLYKLWWMATMPLCTKIGKKDSKREEKRLRRKMQAGHENLNAVNLAGEYFCPKRRKYQEQWEVEKINGCKCWLSGAEIFVGKHGNVQGQGSAAMTSGLSL